MMKKILLLTVVVGVSTLGAAIADAASLTGIYDFGNLDATQTSFEGIDFDADGNLWITSAPNQVDAENTLLKVTLDTVLKTGEVVDVFDFSSSPNPVGLAIDGYDIFASNVPGGVYSVSVEDDTAVTGANVISDFWTSVFFNMGCPQPEGAAYYNDSLYVSCENGKVFSMDPETGTYAQVFDTGTGALGLGATDDGKLIIGQYNEADPLDRSFLLYDIGKGGVTEEIDLNDLFVGAESDYAKLMGEEYSMTIVDNGDIRSIPDPDGLAYYDGKIYMTFEHDLRVFEIELDPPAVPEPGTLLLVGIGLLGLAKLRKKRWRHVRNDPLI